MQSTPPVPVPMLPPRDGPDVPVPLLALERELVRITIHCRRGESDQADHIVTSIAADQRSRAASMRDRECER